MAGVYFSQSRDVELSCLYYLETNLDNDWTGITTVKTFKKIYAKDTNLPIVCVRLAETTSNRKEIGNTALDDRYLIIVDIFARSDAQRLDLAYYIKDKLRSGWIHYQHSHESGSNLTLDRTADGRDEVFEFINDMKIEAIETSDVKDRYRHTISITVRKN